MANDIKFQTDEIIANDTKILNNSLLNKQKFLQFQTVLTFKAQQTI